MKMSNEMVQSLNSVKRFNESDFHQLDDIIGNLTDYYGGCGIMIVLG